MKRLVVLLVCTLHSASVGALSFSSTSTDPQDREKELSEKRCATALKRMQNFVKYWGPRPDIYSNYIMYNPKKVGFRGYDLLGDIYYRGCNSASLAPDKRAALTWYQNAALAHLPESQWKLGRMLYLGDGIEADQDKGLQWITSAAIEGSSDAAAFLRSVGEQPPSPISPNTFSTAMAAAKAQLDSARAAQWRAVTQDLGDLLLAGATIAAAAYAGQSAVQNTRPANYAPTPLQVSRFRPVYCQYMATANSYYPNSVHVRVTQMCH